MVIDIFSFISNDWIMVLKTANQAFKPFSELVDMIPESLRKDLVRQHYKTVGNHSAVKLCTWTRKSLRDEGFCYKEKFYGIKSHRCLQMTPNITCDQRCRICWRIIERTQVRIEKWDEPKDIIQEAIKNQRLLLSGFKGFGGTNLAKFREAQNPTNAAISLLGEPLLYPKISELIEEFHKMNIITFLVTNSQHPEILAKIAEPSQLYISVDAPDKESYAKLDRPRNKNYWKRLLASLEVMNSFSCKKVLRLTMVKGWNMQSSDKYAKLIEIANPDFIELKAYMHVGESMKRLPREAMPLHKDVRAFAKQVSQECGYPIKDEQKDSRVVLLSR
jgi:tRNA wybutosine-synthesizing protein 1